MNNPFSLEGKNAWITGASYGIGFNIAKAFVAAGIKNIIFNDINEEALKRGLDNYAAEGIKNVHGYVCNVTDETAVAATVEKIHAEVGQIDILVNNAGILEKGLKPIDRFEDCDLDRILETNTKGTMRCIRAAAQNMQPGASIINIASIAGHLGCGGAAYVASKAAVIGVTKHTALRFQTTGIRCNAICPGTIVTPMVMGQTQADMDPDMIGAMAIHSNLKTQPCMPEDIANVVLFLASDESRPLTGQVLVTDFGANL